MTTKFEDSTAALQWLYGTQMFGVKLGLENIRRLLDKLQLPDPRQRFFHVAGTNGKGSTCAFIHSLLTRAAGARAGLFTSPHLIHFNERISDGERLINDAEIAKGLGWLRAEAEALSPHPTFFELALALALDWFQQRNLDWGVMETGLGGRLDATNVLSPAVSVITHIGLDHTEILGDSLEKIAAEKAGIIKPGVPVVTGPQAPEVLTVLRQTARRQGSELIEVAEPYVAGLAGLAGEHQAWNAALALAAFRAAGFDLPDATLSQAIAGTHWPGRFELFDGGSLVLDGAHNPDAVAALTAAWRTAFGDEKAALVFGMVREKDLYQVLRGLAPIVRHWHLTAFDSPRALSPVDVAQALAKATDIEAPVTLHDSVRSALAAARGSPPCLVAGSLFLVGAARAQLLGQTEGIQVSAQ